MSSRSKFVERLSAIAEMVGSVNALAKKAGVSQTGLRNYLLHSEPTRPVIEAIANAAGVSPEWLSYGRAPMCGPGSSVPIRAREELSRTWQAARSDPDRGTGSWEDFYRRVCFGEDLGVPAWIKFALAASNAPDAADEPTSGASPAREEPEIDDGVLGDLLITFLPEVARWNARASTSPEMLLSVRRAAGGALKQLQAGIRTNGRRPSASTIRSVLAAHIHRANPDLSLNEQESESEHIA